MSDLSFTHLDPLGRARMVDVTPKDPTHRRAVAQQPAHLPQARPAHADFRHTGGKAQAAMVRAGIEVDHRRARREARPIRSGTAQAAGPAAAAKVSANERSVSASVNASQNCSGDVPSNVATCGRTMKININPPRNENRKLKNSDLLFTA